jgi:RimJ/RimL family protein N-acetyltransferase
MKRHTLLYGFDEQLARWACERVPWADYNPHMKAVGVSSGPEASDKLLAVVIYHDYRPPKSIGGVEWYNTVEMSIAAASPSWATRGTIIDLLKIPFSQFKVRKVRLVCPSTNKRAIRFAEGIGFTPEGTLRHEYAKGVHACVLGLLRTEFEHGNFLKKRKKPAKRSRSHGQEHAVSAAATASA